MLKKVDVLALQELACDAAAQQELATELELDHVDAEVFHAGYHRRNTGVALVIRRGVGITNCVQRSHLEDDKVTDCDDAESMVPLESSVCDAASLSIWILAHD